VLFVNLAKHSVQWLFSGALSASAEAKLLSLGCKSTLSSSCPSQEKCDQDIPLISKNVPGKIQKQPLLNATSLDNFVMKTF